MKRLVLCCDGTWNTPDQSCAGTPCQTNVTKVATAVEPADGAGVRQLMYYQPGVGTSPGERLRGGAFGMGLSRGVQEVYRFVVENYEPGDELFFFGFSRGAYMARSAAGLIRNAGILRPQNVSRIGQAYALYRDRVVDPKHVESRLFRRSFAHQDRTPVRFLGVWDTVGSLGIPWSGIPAIDRLNRPWQFHDTKLSSTVQAAFQALAIDEARRPFAPAIWQQQPYAADQVVEQVWFSGVHSDIGGGYAEAGLSDIALGWMVDRARSCGLAFHEGAFRPSAADEAAAIDPDSPPFAPDPLGRLHDSRTGLFRLLPAAARTVGAEATAHEYVASSAIERMAADPTYAPVNLTRALSGLHEVMPV